jgi:hypothetical protein
LNGKELLPKVIIGLEDHGFETVTLKLGVRTIDLLLSLYLLPINSKGVFHPFKVRSHLFKVRRLSAWELMRRKVYMVL